MTRRAGITAPIEIDADFRASFAPTLVSWFDNGARVLPWRTSRTAYRVWVSEVMLQQTRVATVIPYFERFVARFPEVSALAQAEVGDVLALWSGLGYYRRARALHDGARQVVAQMGGEIPSNLDALRSIRGIGAYTAGAIASLAFGARAAVVDGNVMRVYARVFAITLDVKLSATQRAIWAITEELIPQQRPGAFNEALMELGATVCTPREPKCLVCPVRPFCAAHARGLQRELPFVGKAKGVPTVHAAALVARQPGTVLLGRRRGDALFGGLWEPPMIEADEPDAAEDAVLRMAPGAERAGAVTHVLSHRRMEIRVLTGAPQLDATYPPLYDEVRFVAEADLPTYGVSTLARKVLEAAAAGETAHESGKGGVSTGRAEKRKATIEGGAKGSRERARAGEPPEQSAATSRRARVPRGRLQR